MSSHELATVESFFDGVFETLEKWAPNVERDIAAQLTDGALTGAQLADLVESGSLEILKSEKLPIYGAGFCASEKVVAQGNPLAWWQGPNREPLASSTFGVGPGAVDLRRLEWYRVPEATLQKSIAGPFVDYLCSNELTITSSLPLVIDGEFAGVLCLDVLVSDLENILFSNAQNPAPALNENSDVAASAAVTVLNKNRRVVASTDSAIETGDKFTRTLFEDELTVLAESERYPFLVAQHRPAEIYLS